MNPARNPWFKVGLDAWSLGVEAASVIGLRTLAIASGGPAADAEARRMIPEKVDAAFALQTLAVTGGLGLTPLTATSRALTLYSRKVKANRRRLSRP